jgi:hypothetical protein
LYVEEFAPIVTPCQDPPRPITSKPSVCILAMRSAASLLSLPVDMNIIFCSASGSSAPNSSASCATGGEIRPLNRCTTSRQLCSIASVTAGWLWPSVAHIWPEQKSSTARPFSSKISVPLARIANQDAKLEV